MATAQQHTPVGGPESGFDLGRQTRRYSPEALARFRPEVDHLFVWCEARGKDHAKLSAEVIRELMADLQSTWDSEELYSAEWVTNVLKTICSFYRWLSWETGCANPMRQLPASECSSLMYDPTAMAEEDASVEQYRLFLESDAE